MVNQKVVLVRQAAKWMYLIQGLFNCLNLILPANNHGF
ncbi:hypothetical protein VP01_2354g2 [Puccinia sorghi]|uniref:Uncharacterized protein n=1 Tax=Puccinia sorghi TaxID=27349 RepID=A0A0L6V955_9BASI|nr:hypothetical protein VP01_2354g2 [Puccinia sorghi]